MKKNEAKSIITTDDMRKLGALGMVLGIGVWLFPRTTAIIGSAALLMMKIDEIDAKNKAEAYVAPAETAEEV